MEDEFYILATDASAEAPKRVLKDSETFAVFDLYGDIQANGPCQEGLYHEGTRFLSHLAFKLGRTRPFLLNSNVQKDNLLFIANMTNPDIYQTGKIILPRGTLHITRTKMLWQATCYETLKFSNYGLSSIEVQFSVEYCADFADLFEVRGMTRERKGVLHEARLEQSRLRFDYTGLDGVARRTQVECSPAPDSLSADGLLFRYRLDPRQKREFYLTYSCQIGDAPAAQASYSRARAAAQTTLALEKTPECRVHTSNERFNDWLVRSSADLHMMFTRTPLGVYPYAGVPWFSTAFGRDGIITALEYLWINPPIASGVLSYLAATQAQEIDAQQDAEPGKIMHETRTGEMAALGEIPFSRYYGTVDATPLFVMLAGAYYESTHNLDFIRSIWPNIEHALNWLESYGDRDGDGFIEYARYSANGLVQQGWKDSWDSVSHADGSLATAPIALCEVQGYAYAAWRAAAGIASALGHVEKSQALLARAEKLKDDFHKQFWCADISTYALALDGQKRQCRVKSSNAGHCLYTGIADKEHAGKVADTLMDKDSFSGWGVRTLAASEARFNPMAYHNGSVWPHDNALIAGGLARFGFKEYANKIFAGLFRASMFVEFRLPELFCGFEELDGQGPVPYPVACAPQSWSAAAVFSLLGAVLGLRVDGAASRLSFVRPTLPDFLDEIAINNLTVGAGAVDLLIHRRAHSATIEIRRRSGDVEVITES
ncbi:MAG TPA: amylo-alpha-1,6-glucosidase [Candidatus Binatia bacterium]|jgi:glycogen debranching enzyme